MASTSVQMTNHQALNNLVVPIRETTQSLVSKSPYQMTDYGFKEAFDTYSAELPAIYSIIGVLVALRIAYSLFRLEGSGSFFKIFQSVLTCYFWLWFFPDFFRFLLSSVALLQKSVLSVGLPVGVEARALSRTSGFAWSTVAVSVGLSFAGPVGWFLSLCLSCVVFLPSLIALFYGKAFLLGIGVLIILAPPVIVGSTLLEIGMALKVFNFSLISLLMWPFLWSAFGRVGLLLIGNAETGLIEAALITLILGLLQGASPIILMHFFRGANPGEAIAGLMGKVVRGAASLPVGSLASPLLGISAGIEELRQGAKLSKTGSFSSSSSRAIPMQGSSNRFKTIQSLRAQPRNHSQRKGKIIKNKIQQPFDQSDQTWKSYNAHRFFQAGIQASGSVIEEKTQGAVVKLGRSFTSLIQSKRKEKQVKKKDRDLRAQNIEAVQQKSQLSLPEPEGGYIQPSSKVYQDQDSPIHLRKDSQVEMPKAMARTFKLNLSDAKSERFLKSLSQKFDLKPIPRFGSLDGEIKTIASKENPTFEIGKMSEKEVFGIFSKKDQSLRGIILGEKRFQTSLSTQVGNKRDQMYYYNPNKISHQELTSRHRDNPGYSVDTYLGPTIGRLSHLISKSKSDGIWIDVRSKDDLKSNISFIPNEKIVGSVELIKPS